MNPELPRDHPTLSQRLFPNSAAFASPFAALRLAALPPLAPHHRVALFVWVVPLVLLIYKFFT